MNQQLSEIKEALSKISGTCWITDDANGIVWNDEGRVIINYTADEEEADLNLIANAPQWLASLVSQVEAATTALEDIIECSDIETAVQEIARNTLQSLKGDKP